MSFALGGSVVDVLNDYAAVRYTNVAFIAFMIYDHLITFDSEVSRIWPLRWRLPKILFLINRYIVPSMLIFDAILPTLFNLPGNMCIFIARWTSWPTIMSLGTVECILLLRVFAICGHKKSIQYSLSAFFICEMAAWLTLSVMIMNGTTGQHPRRDFFPGCLFFAPVYFYAAWIPAVIFESVIILTLYSASAYYNAKMQNPTLYILARVNALFLRYVLNLFIARFGKGFLGSLLIAGVTLLTPFVIPLFSNWIYCRPSSVIACVGAARMMMNIGEVTSQDVGDSQNLRMLHLTSGTESKIEFSALSQDRGQASGVFRRLDPAKLSMA